MAVESVDEASPDASDPVESDGDVDMDDSEGEVSVRKVVKASGSGAKKTASELYQKVGSLLVIIRLCRDEHEEPACTDCTFFCWV